MKHPKTSSAPRALRYLPDCPKCKFGTLDRKKVPIVQNNTREEILMWVCADCGHRFAALPS